VNRVKITGLWASGSLVHSPNAAWRKRVKEYWHHLVFRFVLFTLDLAFWRSKLVAWVKEKILRKGKGGGFEEELERNVREFAKGSLGIDVGANVFTR
jgi:aarF domain-containing kinase